MKKSAPTAARASVLIIDDEPAERDMLARELSAVGLDVLAVASGTEAIAVMQVQKFDVTVTEYEMANLDGLETMMALKELDPGLEVIIAGADSASETASRCLAKGAYAYIFKPYHVAEVLLLVERARDKRQLQATVSLYQLCQAMLTPHPRETMTQMIIDLGAEVLGADATAFGLGYPLLKEVDFHALESGPPIGIALGDQLAQQAYQVNEGVRMTNGLVQAGIFGSVRIESVFRSALVYPLILQGQVQGAFMALRTAERPDFTAAEQSLGALFVEHVAMAMENERLFSKLQTLAVTDDVTGLFSRRFLFETLWQLLKRISRTDPPALSCVMIGIDQPAETPTTDSDRVLKKVAMKVCQTVRGSDVAARYGTREFVVLLPLTDRAGGSLVAEKMRKAFDDMDLTPGVKVSISLAGYEGPILERVRSMKDASDFSMKLLGDAEKALEEARDTGRITIWTDPA